MIKSKQDAEWIRKDGSEPIMYIVLEYISGGELFDFISIGGHRFLFWGRRLAKCKAVLALPSSNCRRLAKCQDVLQATSISDRLLAYGVAARAGETQHVGGPVR